MVTGASIPMGQGGHVPPQLCPPNIYEGGDIYGNVPNQYFRSDVV